MAPIDVAQKIRGAAKHLANPSHRCLVFGSVDALAFRGPVQSMAARDNDLSFVWFLGGLSLGTFLGVLYAPRAGSETRQDIKDTVEEGREYLKELGREARESAVTLVERAKNAIEYQTNQLGSAIEVGRDAYRDATDKNSPDA